METKDLVQMCLDNLKKDEALVEKAKGMVAELIDGFVVSNAEIIVAIEDEKQFFDVVDGLLNAAITNQEIEEMVKLPFFLEPFDGIAIEQYRGKAQRYVLGFLNVKVLDWIFGAEWFVYLKEKAATVIAGYKK